MFIVVNGKETEVTQSTLSELVEHYKLNPEHVVAEVDEEIIERQDWQKYQLKPGLKIELIHFVGGG